MPKELPHGFQARPLFARQRGNPCMQVRHSAIGAGAGAGGGAGGTVGNVLLLPKIKSTKSSWNSLDTIDTLKNASGRSDGRGVSRPTLDGH